MTPAPAGDNAFLAELGNVSAEELHAAALDARRDPAVAAVIPGHSSLYVIRGSRDAMHPSALREPRVHELRVAFDGPDLEELLARVRRADFVERVAALTLTARYLGFRGGFAYLDGWPEEWSMPRRPTSRPLVRRGTFAVAGSVAAFYPVDSPGGWNLLGRTDADLEHALVPGDRLRLVPVDAVDDVPPRRGDAPRLRSSFADFISAPLCIRVPARDLSNLERGIAEGGPFDEIAASLAASAVGGEAELFECAMTGPRVRFTRDAAVAWCDPRLDVRVQEVRSGEELAFGKIEGGLRAYLAIGEAPAAFDRRPAALRERSDRHFIHALAGPHDIGLGDVECEVTAQLNRVGIRLRPSRAIGAVIPADLRSCGMQCGTVQLHPDGSMIAMGPDHPVTGGYLQPMTVLTSERWKLAQLTPGERVVLRCRRG